MSDDGDSGLQRSPISEGILIASLPAFAYAIAYAYEAGFCSVFRIPTHLIQLGLVNVLAGGYTPDLSKVVEVHLGTFDAAAATYR